MNYLALLKYAPYLLVAALISYGVYYIYESGVEHEATKRELATAQANLAATKHSLDEYQANVVYTAQVEQKRTETNTAIKTITKEVIREVPIYLPADAAPLPGGFRLLHDAAASGTSLPDTAPTGSADAQPVPVADAASTVAANYGQYNALANDMRLLQQWVGKECKSK